MRNVFYSVSFFFLFCGIVKLSADGFRNPPVGASAQGRFGGNFVFTPDSSAVTLNPANLTGFTQPETMVSFTFGYSNMEFTSVLGPKVETEDPWALLPAVYLVLPPDEGSRWNFGLGITSPYGRSSSLPNDNPFSTATPYFTQLMSLQVSPTFAVRITDRLSAGISLNLLYSELDLRQKYPWDLALGIPGLPTGATYFDANGTGLGATASLSFQLNDQQRLALRVQSPVKISYDGKMEVTGIPLGVPALEESGFETEITFPLVVAFGYGIQFTERLQMEANVEWAQHSEFEQLDLNAGSNTALLPADSIPTGWEDNWTFGVSANYQLNPQWILRAGYQYLESPVPSSTMLPTTAEQDQGVLGVGAGYRISDQHQLDFSYAVGFFDGRNVQDNLNPAFNGQYDFEAHLISVNYGYRF